MVFLTDLGIKHLAEKISIPIPYVLQIIEIQPLDFYTYSVKVSDGFASFDVTFLGSAAEEIRNGNIIQKCVIELQRFNYSQSNEQQENTVLISEIKMIQSEVKKIIGAPINYAKYKSQNFTNEAGSNKLEDEEPYFFEHPEVYLKKGAANFGFSFVAGLCAAYFVKKIAKAAAFITGGFFLTLQIMAYNGLVTVHWHKFKPARIDFRKFMKIISVSSTGFGMGFYFGIKKEIRSVVG